jgi:Protein O-mannosyl-transferase TMEM260-like
VNDAPLGPDPSDPATMRRHPPPYGMAAVTGLALFALYVVTLAPTTAFWDTSEYIATASILGIPHPPGNPLFVVLARVWLVVVSPLGLSVAVRMNLFAAATSAAASSLLFLVAHRMLLGVLESDVRARVGACAAAVVGGTVFTVWNQSTVNEKVYTVSVLVIAAVTWLAVLWRDRRERPGSERYLLWALFLLAIGSTNHLMSALPAPALAVLVLLNRPLSLLRPGFLARAFVLAVLGLSFNFVLPVRASLDPVINEGEATCASVGGAAVAIYTNGKAGCPALAYNLARKQYQKPPVTERQAPFGAQVWNYVQYFEWQWARGVEASELPGGPRTPLALVFTALGLAGLWAAWRADRALFAYLLTLCLTLTLGLVYYLNFKYGNSLAPEVTDRALHEVRERDYFFVASFLLWGVLAGVGLAWCWGALASFMSVGRRHLVTAPVLLLALLPLGLNWRWASRAGDWAARDWAWDLLMSVEPYGILFTNGDNDTFPLWYLQEVEGVRKDVTVVVGQYLFTTWYPRQLAHLTEPGRQRPFDPGIVPGLYAAPAAPPPDAITGLTPEQMDGVTGARLAKAAEVPFPEVTVTYPAGAELNREQQLALAFIHDAVEERPIYFAGSGGLISELGLDRWGVRQGLVVKLELRSLDGPPPAGVVQGSDPYGAERFDVPRSLKLYQDVYRYRSLRDRAVWADRSTLNIPWHYYAMALQLSDVVRKDGGDAELVKRLQDDAMAFRVVSQGGLLGTPEGTGS